MEKKKRGEDSSRGEIHVEVTWRFLTNEDRVEPTRVRSVSFARPPEEIQLLNSSDRRKRRHSIGWKPRGSTTTWYS